jgi:subtilase family serine protease
LKPNVWVARRRTGAVVAIGTAGSLLLLGAGTAVAASPSPPASRVAVPQGVAPAVLKTAHAVGKTAAATKETVSFIMKAKDLGGLEAAVNAGMPHGRLSVGQFRLKYGRATTPTGVITILTKYLAGFGIKSTVHADHLDVTTRGTAAQYDAALFVQQQDFMTAAVPAHAGHPARPAIRFHGTAQPATLPTNAGKAVLAILGLTNYPVGFNNAVHTPALAAGVKPAAKRTGNLKPSDFAKRYGLTPLLNKGAKGQGQTIGIVTLASMFKADARHFWTTNLKIKTKPNRITLDNIDGGAGPVEDRLGSGETTLDVEQSGALAPDANIIVYQAPNSDAGFIDAFAEAASQNKAGSVSSSWGESEEMIAAAVDAHAESDFYAQAFDEIFLELAAQGQSTFIASGDAGAYDSSDECFFPISANECLGTADLAVDNPGDSPWVTDAGGMTLAGTIPLSSKVNAVINRRAWGWDWLWPHWKLFGAPTEKAFALAELAGGGGGYSAIETRPGYQKRWVDVNNFNRVKYLTPDPASVKTVNNFTAPTAWKFNAKPGAAPGSSGGRAVPDLSANADPYTGYIEYFSKFTGPNLESGWGGTSFVAPQFAGATAVMNSFLHKRVGFWNPALYHFASWKTSPVDPVETVGRTNDNLYYTGTKGHRYNPAAGLGTPDFARLAADFRHHTS